MKLSRFTFGIAIAITAFSSDAKAQNYPWCAIYGGGSMGGATNCGFVSFEQCMATARGLGSFCVQNTLYVPPRGSHRRRSPY